MKDDFNFYVLFYLFNFLFRRIFSGCITSWTSLYGLFNYITQFLTHDYQNLYIVKSAEEGVKSVKLQENSGKELISSITSSVDV